MGRLRLDRPSGFLRYDNAQSPNRIPVYACANWGAADPSQRLPVLVFDQAGGLQQVVNPSLLPASLSRGTYNPITNLEAQPFSCSPGSGGSRQNVTVSYNAPS